MVTQAQEQGLLTSSIEPEQLLAMQFAITIGLIVLGPTMAQVLSLDDTSPRARGQQLMGNWLSLIAGPASSETPEHKEPRSPATRRATRHTGRAG